MLFPSWQQIGSAAFKPVNFQLVASHTFAYTATWKKNISHFHFLINLSHRGYLYISFLENLLEDFPRCYSAFCKSFAVPGPWRSRPAQNYTYLSDVCQSTTRNMRWLFTDQSNAQLLTLLLPFAVARDVIGNGTFNDWFRYLPGKYRAFAPSLLHCFLSAKIRKLTNCHF